LLILKRTPPSRTCNACSVSTPLCVYTTAVSTLLCVYTTAVSTPLCVSTLRLFLPLSVSTLRLFLPVCVYTTAVSTPLCVSTQRLFLFLSVSLHYGCFCPSLCLYTMAVSTPLCVSTLRLFLPLSVSLHYGCFYPSLCLYTTAVSTPLCVYTTAVLPLSVSLHYGYLRLQGYFLYPVVPIILCIPGGELLRRACLHFLESKSCVQKRGWGPEATSEDHRHREAVLLQQTQISSAKFTPPFSNPFCAMFNFDNKWLPILNIQAMVITLDFMAPPLDIAKIS
jgi:hypothetical protein